MRDPNRIEPILKELEKYWRKYPDWRLAQVICNLGREVGMFDPFYLEDNHLLKLLQAHNKE